MKELLKSNIEHNTTFVITGDISKVEAGESVSFSVESQISKKGILNNDYRIYSTTTARFYEFPKHVSHKILQNLNRRVKITIELIDDEDYNE